MPTITIGGTIINFPNSGAEQAWSPAVIQFAEAVQDALLSAASPFNVSPRVVNLDDSDTDLPLQGLDFNTVNVRKFSLNYVIKRQNGSSPSTRIIEAGILTGAYNGNAWTIQDEYFGDRQTNGLPYHTFAMSGNTVQLTTVELVGSVGYSTISYSALTELVSNI